MSKCRVCRVVSPKIIKTSTSIKIISVVRISPDRAPKLISVKRLVPNEKT